MACAPDAPQMSWAARGGALAAGTVVVTWCFTMPVDGHWGLVPLTTTTWMVPLGLSAVDMVGKAVSADRKYRRWTATTATVAKVGSSTCTVSYVTTGGVTRTAQLPSIWPGWEHARDVGAHLRLRYDPQKPTRVYEPQADSFETRLVGAGIGLAVLGMAASLATTIDMIATVL